MIMPIALGYSLLSGHIQPAGAESGGAWVLLFLPVCLPPLPLLLFAEGAKRSAAVSSRYITIYCTDHHLADRAVHLP